MITINHLSFAYKKRNQLFRDLDLEIVPGNIYGLLGKNGAGKLSGGQFYRKGKLPAEVAEMT